MEYSDNKNTHFRHLLYFAFRRGLNATQAVQEICNVYGENSIVDRTGREWFTKFKNCNIQLNDAPRVGRLSEFDDDGLKQLLNEDGRQTSRELSERIGCSPQTILNRLNSMGYTQKVGTWVPHMLTQKNKEIRSSIACQNLARHRATRGHNDRFLNRIVTGDEKWCLCLYVNNKLRKEWTAQGDTAKPKVKPDAHPKKTMICVWWDHKGLIHWEMLDKNKTVDKELYLAQLHRVNEAILQKRPDRRGRVILLHDNVMRAHTFQTS